MKIVFISLIVFLTAFGAMAIGVIVKNQTIKGSCGGLSQLFGKGSCEICEDRDECENNKNKQSFSV